MVSLPIVNSGHIPSGLVTIVQHWIIIKIDDPTATTANSSTFPTDHILERKWSEFTFPSVPIGSEYSVEPILQAIDADQFNSGKMRVMMAAIMTYNDGFPDSANQTWESCFVSRYDPDTKTASLRPCVNPDMLLKSLTALDGYPDTQNEEKWD